MVENNENNGLQNTVTPVPETPATPVTPVASEVPFTPRAIETPVSVTPVETPAPVEPVTEPAPIVPDPVAPVEPVVEPVAPAPVETPVAETPVAETPVTSEVTTEPAAMSNEAVMNTATVGEVPTEPTTAPVESGTESLPEEPKKKSGALKVILIILVLAAIAGGVVYYLATKDAPKPVEEPTNNTVEEPKVGKQDTTIGNYGFTLDSGYALKIVEDQKAYYNDTLKTIISINIHNNTTLEMVKANQAEVKNSFVTLGHENVTSSEKQLNVLNTVVYEGTCDGKPAFLYLVEYNNDVIEVYGVSTGLEKEMLSSELERIIKTAEIKNEVPAQQQTTENPETQEQQEVKFTLTLAKSIISGIVTENRTTDNVQAADPNVSKTENGTETKTESETEKTPEEQTTEDTQTEPEVIE